MTEIALFACIGVLLASATTLFILLQNQKKQTIPQNVASFDDIFQSIPLPFLYKKENKLYYNKAFEKAFGSFLKATIDHISTLPKSGEHPLLLTFDNNIPKQTTVHMSTLFDAQNSIIGFAALIVDISALHKSKELLLTQKERLELALEGSDEAFWDWDMKSDDVFYSPKWKQLMGYHETETPSTLSSWLNLVHSKDMALVNERLKAHLDGHSEYFMVDHRIRQSEPLRWVKVRGRVIRGKNDRNIRMVGIIRDISQQKASAAQETIEHERFIAFVEHIPAPAFIKNAQGKYLYMNQAYQKFIGFKTWKNRNAADIFDSHTAEEIAETDRLSLYEGIVTHDISLPTAEGAKSYFHLYKFGIESENEKLLCGFGINKPFKE
ncbi:putative diguanylate cyclase [Sulfurospirillum diekertiae]|uniref:histidine kinase n=1 Tax=Sulfurospirillum diekertiae TaxID=1854492 RepID=A0A290HGY8_9BACT|nr:PAS domain-containing protein [Sulfurospirillum diekertiae]ATB70697.1 putative diguanylate cyclase [Sulfurospirillum diekertiae]